MWLLLVIALAVGRPKGKVGCSSGPAATPPCSCGLRPPHTATRRLALGETGGRVGQPGCVASALAATRRSAGLMWVRSHLHERGLTAAVAWSRHSPGMLELGLGRYDSAFEQLSEIQNLPAIRFVSISDQIEAAFRAGRADRIDAAYARFRPWAEHVHQPWAQAVVERCRALTCPPSEVEQHFAMAVRLHAQGGRPLQRARTDLLYGEWLRRSRRPTDARTELRAALEIFERLEATPWADRTRNELRAAGEIAARRTSADPLSQLTPQELQVVRLAATGATNREIAGQLFLGPRTVGYHLYKAYPKLSVSSRRGLATISELQRLVRI
jgi:DNA-binding CsgD family transcriptional regulator